MNVPYTIKTIFEQMKISFMRVGGSALGFYMQNPKYTAKELKKYSCYPEKDSTISADGRVLMDVGLYFRVNTTRKIYMFVAYETDDTYTVYMWRPYTVKEVIKNNNHDQGKVLAERRGVYCDNLGEVIERLYDKYIEEHQNGFIHI